MPINTDGHEVADAQISFIPFAICSNSEKQLVWPDGKKWALEKDWTEDTSGRKATSHHGHWAFSDMPRTVHEWNQQVTS